MLPDMFINTDLLSYLPILLAQALSFLALSLFDSLVDYHTLLPFTFILIHTLLIIITFHRIKPFFTTSFYLSQFYLLFPLIFLNYCYLSAMLACYLIKNCLQSTSLWAANMVCWWLPVFATKSALRIIFFNWHCALHYFHLHSPISPQ